MIFQEYTGGDKFHINIKGATILLLFHGIPLEIPYLVLTYAAKPDDIALSRGTLIK
jgi:hypothetical protein